MHKQRNDADGDEHHGGEAINKGAHLELQATDLEPGDRAHNRRNTLVLATVGLGLRGMALARFTMRVSRNCFARILCGGIDLFADGFAGLRGEPIRLDDVGSKCSTSWRVVDAIDPVAGNDDGQDEAD
ncbi:MAG TPA: hypothetical protein DEB20_01950 [Acidimicrobiaceae bacterium]|nr:hypothetical protein [Acidimicrobiaceae bacterium]